LEAQNRTKDSAINEISIHEQRIVISKDTDFYHSHLLQGRPWRLVLVRIGNIGSRDLIALFRRHLPVLVASLEENTFIELYREGVRIVA
jgi:predicted nuclease of predicted toxin-antitoxin system